MESSTLIRFISLGKSENIFNLDEHSFYDSTFIMRSLSYYQTCENEQIRDINESKIIQTINGQSYNRGCMNDHLISCWSIYDNIDIEELSKKFCPNGGIAIISSINKIDKLLKYNLLGLLQKKPEICLMRYYTHKKVSYYPETASKDECCKKWKYEAHFHKSEKFDNECEYRFSLDPQALHPMNISTIIFQTKAKDYIDKIIMINNGNIKIEIFCKEKEIPCEFKVY